MSESRLYLGIDFGTSNSSVSYVYHDPRDADARCIDAKVLHGVQDIPRNGKVPQGSQLADVRRRNGISRLAIRCRR